MPNASIDLYTAATPNGFKASITLEELALPYNLHPIDLGERDQKKEWFLNLNPNGRIPVIIDKEAGDFPVFESGAIMVYLAEKTSKLLPTDVKGRSVVMQWLMFQMGGLGPMMGQANVFVRYAPEQIPYAIDRYRNESRRLLEVLNTQLEKSQYLGKDYSIADIANFAWARGTEWSGIDISGLDHLSRWLDEIENRPAVQKGLQSPPRNDSSENAKEIVDAAQKMLV